MKKWKKVVEKSCRFFFNETATTESYTLSLHDALPILSQHILDLLPLEETQAAVDAIWNSGVEQHLFEHS